MPTARACPDVAQYQRLFTGRLSAPEQGALLAHLEGCEVCFTTVEHISTNDTLVELIRRARTGPEEPGGDAVGRLVEQLRELRPSTTGKAPDPARIAVACPGCGKGLKVKPGLAGKKVKCPHCQAAVAVPGTPVPAGQEQTRAPEAAAIRTMTLAPGSPAGPGGRQEGLCDFLAPAQAPDELGRLGPYRVLKVLGAGGMGVVFQAEDPHLQRLVALKALLPGRAASESARQRFLREARAAAAIKHDHIVTIHQVGEDGGVPFLAMEFLEGEPLDARLEREGKLPLVEVLRIGREIAEGLAAAHERGLTHRDIKPANIWLESKSEFGIRNSTANSEFRIPNSDFKRVKILDFGLARAAGDEAHLTQQGAIVGTPAYMAPEQAQGKAVDPRCDLFSLGCVLYRMAAGQPPFRGTDLISTLMAVATENPRPPHQLDASLPPALSKLIMALLQKEPGYRPASARVVADTLEQIAREQAPRPGAAVPGDRKPERQRGKARYSPGPALSRLLSTRRRRLTAALVGLAVLLPLGFWLGGLVVRVTSDKGTLVIETDDPGVEVKITDQGGATVTYGPDRREIRLRPGEYGIELAEAKDGLNLSTPHFTIRRGSKEAVKVRWEKKDAGPALPEALPQTFKNGLGMEFVLIPKGKSWLGGGGGKFGDEEVEITQDLYLGKYEVTQEEWQKMMDFNPSHFSRGGAGKDAVKDIADEDQKRFPVELVSWNDCQQFVKLLNEKARDAGWRYRLPTQVEWEYACRGGPMTDRFESAFDFYFSKPANKLAPDQANFGKGASGRTSRVDAFKPNRLGLHDMHGNVHQWCEEEPMVRGGSFWSPPDVCRAGFRFPRDLPAKRAFNVGFRLARVRADKEPAAPPPPAVKKPEMSRPTFPIDHTLRRAYMNREGDWRVEGDELVQETMFGNCRLAFGDFAWKDYDYTVDIKKVGDIADGGLDYHVSGAGHGLIYTPGRMHGNIQFASSWDRGIHTHIKRSSGTMEKNRWYQLTLRLRGTQCQLIRDDQLVLEYEDKSNPRGAVGLWSAYGAVRFRNIRVTDPEGKVLFHGLPQLPAITGQWLPATEPASPGELYCLKGHNCPVTGLTFSADGRQVLSCSDGETLGANTRQGPVRWYSPPSNIRLWDAATGKELDSVSVDGARGFVKLARAPVGPHFVTHTRDHAEVRLWSAANGKIQALSGLPASRLAPPGPQFNSNGILDLGFTPDGCLARALSVNTGAVWEWNVADRILVRQYPGTISDVSCTVLTPDAGHALLARRNQPFAEIDLATGKETGRWKEAVGVIRGMAIAPDGKRVVTGGEDGTVRLWDVATAKHVHLVGTQPRLVHAVAISPDGRRALTGGEDQVVRLWDLDGKKELASFTGHTAGVIVVAFSPDGTRAASGSSDYTIRLWRLPAVKAELQK